MAEQDTAVAVKEKTSDLETFLKRGQYLGPVGDAVNSKTISVRSLKALGVIKNSDQEVKKERRDLLALILRVLNDVDKQYKEDMDIFKEETFQRTGEIWVCAKLHPLVQIYFHKKTAAPSLLFDYKRRVRMQEELEHLPEKEIEDLEKLAQKQRKDYITKCTEYYREIFTIDKNHPKRDMDLITRCLIDFMMVPLKDERIGEDHEYVEEDYIIYMHAIRAFAPYLNTCCKSEVRRFLQICNVAWVRKNCYTHEIQCVVKYWLMDKDYGTTLAHILGELYADSSSYFDDYLFEHIVDYIVALKKRPLFNSKDVHNLLVFYLCAALIHSPNDFYNTIILENLMKLDGYGSWSIAEVIYREGLIDWTWNGKLWLDYLEALELPVDGTEDILINQSPGVMIGSRDPKNVSTKVLRAQERYDARIYRLMREHERMMTEPAYEYLVQRKKQAAELMKRTALSWLRDHHPVHDGTFPENQWTLVRMKEEWKAAGCPPTGEDPMLMAYRVKNIEKILLDGMTREEKYEVRGPVLPGMKELDLVERCLKPPRGSSDADKDADRKRIQQAWLNAHRSLETAEQRWKDGAFVVIKEDSESEDDLQEFDPGQHNRKLSLKGKATEVNKKGSGVEGRGELKEKEPSHRREDIRQGKTDGATKVNEKGSGAEGKGKSKGEEPSNRGEHTKQGQRDEAAKVNKKGSRAEGKEKSVKKKTGSGKKKGGKPVKGQFEEKLMNLLEEVDSSEDEAAVPVDPMFWKYMRMTAQTGGQRNGVGERAWDIDLSPPAWEGGPTKKQLYQLMAETLNSKNLKHENFEGVDPKRRNAMIRKEALFYICGYCRKVPAYGEKFGVCASCKRAHYCSRECQKKHWKEAHKSICPTLL